MKNKEKGLTLSLWIWIAVGAAIATMTLVAFQMYIGNTGDIIERQKTIDQYNKLYHRINLLCARDIGNKEYFRGDDKLELSQKTTAIYIADSQKEPPIKVSQDIANGETNQGKYLCLKFENSEQIYKCKELDCLSNFTYIGRPQQGSDMWNLMKAKNTFDFDLVLKTVWNKSWPGEVCTPAANCGIKVKAKAEPAY